MVDLASAKLLIAQKCDAELEVASIACIVFLILRVMLNKVS